MFSKPLTLGAYLVISVIVTVISVALQSSGERK